MFGVEQSMSLPIYLGQSLAIAKWLNVQQMDRRKNYLSRHPGA
jgi:hypothetical protein